METPDPNPFPEFKLFGSRRLGEAADFIRNIAHLLFDQMRSNPTHGDHFIHDPLIEPTTPQPMTEEDWERPSGW